MIIKFDEVHFSYDNEPVIANFSLEAKQGDRIVIKGASGSGKTTLFRLLLGFEIPDKGQIYFNDDPLTPECVKRLRKETTWLPQDLDLGQGLLKEVFYYPFSFKNNNAQRPSEKKVLSTLGALGLDAAVWEKSFVELSTGQRQRVGTALCHLLGKTLLLLDEPTSALDDRSKEKVAALLFEDKQRIIISTSHDPWWIDRCTRTVELNP